jgi:hypothetical protein
MATSQPALEAQRRIELCGRTVSPPVLFEYAILPFFNAEFGLPGPNPVVNRARHHGGLHSDANAYFVRSTNGGTGSAYSRYNCQVNAFYPDGNTGSYNDSYSGLSHALHQRSELRARRNHPGWNDGHARAAG